jgi:calcium-dependent protein kinase
MTAAVDKQSVINTQSLRQAFEIIDKDGSGTITVDELKATFESQGTQKDQQLWKEIMKEVDVNGDGEISYQEFTDGMRKFMKNNLTSKMEKGMGGKFKSMMATNQA